MRAYPEIRFANPWLIEPTIRRAWNASRVHKKISYPTPKDRYEKQKLFQKTWKPYERKILKGMCDVLGLEFHQNTIDVFVVGAHQPVSNPLIMPSRLYPQAFVDVLTHELLHRLLTDNTLGLNPMPIWKKMFPGETMNVQVHVLVHATHKYICFNVLKEPKRIELEQKNLAKYKATDYLRSWGIVEERGYRELIEEFKHHY